MCMNFRVGFALPKCVSAAAAAEAGRRGEDGGGG